MAEGPAALTTEDLLRGLECPVCQEHYRDPRILQCGHTLCLKPCLEQIVAGKQRFKCPECRTEQGVPYDGLDHIPKNVAISRQLDVKPIISTSRPKSSICPICGEEDDLRKCGHCEMLICLDCVNEHVPLYRELLKKKFTDILHETDDVIQFLSKETKLEVSLRDNVGHVVKQIDAAEERAIKLIRSKAASLRNDAQSTHQKHSADITSTKKDLGDRLVDFASCCREDEKALCDIHNKPPTTKLRKMGERLSEAPEHTARDLDAIDKFGVLDFATDFKCLEDSVDKCFSLHIHTSRLDHAINEHLGKCAVTVSQEMTVNILSKDMSKAIQTFTTPADSVQLSNSVRVAVDDNTGDVVVADIHNNRVLKFDSRGNLILALGSRGSNRDQFNCPCDIIIDDKSQIIVCDRFNQRIKIHNRDGSLHSILEDNADRSKMFRDPRGIALDTDGYIHVCDWGDPRVQVVTQSGARVFRYHITDGCAPWRIGITEDGIICILSTVSSTNPTKHINILNQKHEQITSWEIPEGSFGMCVTRVQVLVCDHITGKIHVYHFKGVEVKVFDISNEAGCQEPRGLAMDRQGNVYVACRNAVGKF